MKPIHPRSNSEESPNMLYVDRPNRDVIECEQYGLRNGAAYDPRSQLKSSVGVLPLACVGLWPPFAPARPSRVCRGGVQVCALVGTL